MFLFLLYTVVCLAQASDDDYIKRYYETSMRDHPVETEHSCMLVLSNLKEYAAYWPYETDVSFCEMLHELTYRFDLPRSMLISPEGISFDSVPAFVSTDAVYFAMLGVWGSPCEAINATKGVACFVPGPKLNEYAPAFVDPEEMRARSGKLYGSLFMFNVKGFQSRAKLDEIEAYGGTNSKKMQEQIFRSVFIE
jgi:hypothetical protein